MRRQIGGDDVDGVDEVVGGDRDSLRTLRRRRRQFHVAQRHRRVETRISTRNEITTRHLVSILQPRYFVAAVAAAAASAVVVVVVVK